MAFTVNTDIQQAFFDVIDTAAILVTVWPNTDFDTPKPYLRVNYIPFETQSIGISSIDKYGGICQIDVVIEAGLGAIKANQYVDQILDLFTPRPQRLTSGNTAVQISKTGWASPAVQDKDGYFIPISIPYTIIQ